MARTAVAGLALCIGALCANGALAQSQRPSNVRLGDMVFDRSNGRMAAAPPVARYVAEGSVAFVLDRSSPQPLIRFEGSKEIWALYPYSASDNAIIYKNDVGENVLRESRLGGLTVFTATRPEGAWALLDGVGSSLLLPKDVERSFDRLKAASDKTSRAARRPIGVDVPEVGPDSLAVAVDAALVAFDVFDRLAKSDRNAAALGRIGQVLVLEGRKGSRPDVVVRQGSLVITVVPGRGVAGRPSSAKIEKALKG